jgi:hypothetical protein
MTGKLRLGFAIMPLLLLQACVASVVADVVTAPVKIVSKTADVLTTSQSEADEKRRRDMRKHEEKLGKLARQLDKARDRCADGDQDACNKATEISLEIEATHDRPQ